MSEKLCEHGNADNGEPCAACGDCICEFPETCGGSGVVECEGCGGDFCVCAACFGGGIAECECADCGGDDDEDGEPFDEEEASDA